MIISKTPYRVSFFGGGTDFHEWYNQNEGLIISTTINKYSYIFFTDHNKFFDFNYRFLYSKTEELNSYLDSKHPAIRGIFDYYKINEKIVMSHIGDLPSYSGLASSSAFTVGLINCIQTFKKNKLSPNQLYKEAIIIEQKILKEKVGIQDQIGVTIGGLKKIKIMKNGNVIIKKINLERKKLEKLENNLFLLFTKKRRIANNIEESKNFKNIILRDLMELTKYAYELLISDCDSDIDEFGKLLTETWKIKKQLSNKVSNTSIDELFDYCLNNGALGGKMVGAGGGGCVLFYVQKSNQKKFLESLNKYKIFNLKFEDNGSTIIKF